MVNSSYTYAVFGMAAYTFAIGGLAFWLPKFLTFTRGIERVRATSILGLVTVLASITGMSLGGWLADRLSRSNPRALFLVPGVAMLGAIPFVLVGLLSETPAYIFGGIFLAEALMFINTGPCNAVIANVVTPNLRAAAYAIAIFALHFLGDIWSPPLMGWVADLFGKPDTMQTAFGQFFSRLGAVPTATDESKLPQNLLAGMLVVVPALAISGDRPAGRSAAPPPRDGPDARQAQGRASIPPESNRFLENDDDWKGYSLMNQPTRIAITGAGGQIGYALSFRIASGGLFGPDHLVSLSLLEIPQALPSLKGVMMELEDCAFPNLVEVLATDKPHEAFKDADWVILVGGMPRKEGMSRADLIRANGPIFTEQGKAISEAAGPGVRVLTVANPCNTNCLIARSHAPNVPAEHWFAMTRLDQNRATAQLALKAGVPVRDVSHMAIWGNHSDTQYPDYKHAKIAGKPATEVINDASWFTETFMPTVAKRGSAVIKARGASSAASAANAALDSVRSACFPKESDWFSAGVCSDGSYGIPKGLIYSFPLQTTDGRTWSIVQDLDIDADARARLDASAKELENERDAVKDLLGPAV